MFNRIASDKLSYITRPPFLLVRRIIEFRSYMDIFTFFFPLEKRMTIFYFAFGRSSIPNTWLPDVVRNSSNQVQTDITMFLKYFQTTIPPHSEHNFTTTVETILTRNKNKYYFILQYSSSSTPLTQNKMEILLVNIPWNYSEPTT